MQFYDGGAFADCPYIQYPHGMGKQRAPATVISAVTAATAAAASSTTTATMLAARPASSSSSAHYTSRTAEPTYSNSGVPLMNGSAGPSSRAVVVATPSTASVISTSAPTPAARRSETAEEATARTAKGIQDSLRAAQQKPEVFDGRRIALQTRERAAVNKPNAASKALTIVVSSSEGVAGARESDPGPIVRSPTKEKKSIFTDALLLRSGGGSGDASAKKKIGDGAASTALVASSGEMTGNTATTTSSSSSSGNSHRKVVVPFCVSSWQNHKKLIVPVEQRLAQQHDDRTDAEAGMGDANFDLAVAMQQASREVAAEMAAKEKAKAEEEERRQAALEAAEAEKARQLLEQKAAALAANAQRRETREERLERIRLERELREQEKLAKQEQRLRERAAARLNITVADLEADEQLLKTVEEASVHVGANTAAGSAIKGSVAQAVTNSSGVKLEPSSSSFGPQQRGAPSGSAMDSAGAKLENNGDDDDELTGGPRKPAVRGGIFASAVISNEGIRREMEALAAVDAQQQQQQQQPQHHDGIRMRDDDENSADEDEDDGEGGGFQLHNFVKKKQRL